VRFTDELRARADAVWRAQHDHPFVVGLGDGTLDVDRFRFFIRQDYLFLIEYARLLALATARAPDLATMTAFAELTQAILGTEMDLHRSYCAELGITVADLEAETMVPTTRAYTDFLVRTAATGDFAELVAVLLPCMWGYHEVACTLAARGPSPEPLYARWVDMYVSADFAALAVWCRSLTDRLADGLSSAALDRMSDAFVTSSRYELAFWQMAWDREDWPA
jgi:thiaminase/transcriptional activator TenA